MLYSNHVLPQPVSKLRLLIHIDLTHFDIRPFLCNLLYDRNYHTAGSALGRPEIQQDGFIGIHYFFLKIIGTDIDRRHVTFLLCLLF